MKRKMILGRIGQMLIVLVGVTFMTFLLTHIAPGDPASAMYETAGIVPSESQLETIAMSAKYTRQVRAAVLEVLSQDYVTGARERGIRYSKILWRHVLPNAMLPLLTMLGLSFGSLLGGTSIAEITFIYPGLGDLAVNAVKTRDYPLIQGFVIYIALVYMIVNLVVDMSYSLVDPRIREAE